MQKNNFLIIILAFIAFIIQAEAFAIMGPRKIAVIDQTLDNKVPSKFPPKPFSRKTLSDNNINDIRNSSVNSKLFTNNFKKVIVINGKSRSETAPSPNVPVISPEIKKDSIRFQNSVEAEEKRLAAEEAKL